MIFDVIVQLYFSFILLYLFLFREDILIADKWYKKLLQIIIYTVGFCFLYGSIDSFINYLIK